VLRLAEPGDHSAGELFRSACASQVRRAHASFSSDGSEGRHDPPGSDRFAQMFHHQGGSPNGSDRISDAAAGDVRCTAVNGLEERWAETGGTIGETRGIQVGAGG